MTEERICSPKLCKAASGNTSACPPVVEGLLLAHSGRRNATVPRSCVRQLRGTLRRLRTLLEASCWLTVGGGTHLFPEAVEGGFGEHFGV